MTTLLAKAPVSASFGSFHGQHHGWSDTAMSPYKHTGKVHVSSGEIAARIGEAVRQAARNCGWGVKQLAATSGHNPRTIEGLTQERNAPSAKLLIELARDHDEVWHALCELAGRAPAPLTEQQREAALQALALISGSPPPCAPSRSNSTAGAASAEPKTCSTAAE